MRCVFLIPLHCSLPPQRRHASRSNFSHGWCGLQDPLPLSAVSFSLFPSFSAALISLCSLAPVCCPYHPFLADLVLFYLRMCIEPSASHLPGKILTTELNPQTSFELIQSYIQGLNHQSSSLSLLVSGRWACAYWELPTAASAHFKSPTVSDLLAGIGRSDDHTFLSHHPARGDHAPLCLLLGERAQEGRHPGICFCSL